MAGLWVQGYEHTGCVNIGNLLSSWPTAGLSDRVVPHLYPELRYISIIIADLERCLRKFVAYKGTSGEGPD